MKEFIFIFTFGFGQGHDNGYVKFLAEDQGKAEVKMIQHFGEKWGLCYTSPESAGVERYNLHLVTELS